MLPYGGWFPVIACSVPVCNPDPATVAVPSPARMAWSIIDQYGSSGARFFC